MNDTPASLDNSAAFTAMATKIAHNSGEPFGGAAVIVPPVGSGDPIEVLILDNQADPIQFYATLKSRIDRNLTTLDEAQRKMTAFRR